jgi:hypothetical protein
MSTINISCPQCGACMTTRMNSKECANPSCRFYNLWLEDEYIYDIYFSYTSNQYSNIYSIYINLELLKIEKKIIDSGFLLNYYKNVFQECYSEDFNKIHYSKLNEFYSYIKNIITKLEENSILE